MAVSPALYRHGLLSKIALKKVFPSRPDSGGGERPEAGELNGRMRDVYDSHVEAFRYAEQL